MNKWTAIAGTIGGLLGAIGVTVLSASQVDVAGHWATVVAGVTAAVGAAAGAFLVGLRGKGPTSPN